MNHRVHFRPGFVDRAVNMPFRIGCPIVADRFPVQREFPDIADGHQFRAAGPAHKVSFGVFRIADTDMAVSIDHLFAG